MTSRLRAKLAAAVVAIVLGSVLALFATTGPAVAFFSFDPSFWLDASDGARHVAAWAGFAEGSYPESTHPANVSRRTTRGIISNSCRPNSRMPIASSSPNISAMCPIFHSPESCFVTLHPFWPIRLASAVRSN